MVSIWSQRCEETRCLASTDIDPAASPQTLYVNQTLSCVLLNMDMHLQIAVVDQHVEMRSGLIPKVPCSLVNRH